MVDVSAEACLARARAFERMDEEGRRRLASLAQRVALAPGEVLMREGEPGDAFYLLVHGMLRVEAEDLSAQPRRVGTIEPGAVLGEIGVVTSEPRTATVTADTAAAKRCPSIPPGALTSSRGNDIAPDHERPSSTCTRGFSAWRCQLRSS